MMGSYVEIGELKTWYDEQGAGEPLVLLHGCISTNETWGAQCQTSVRTSESSPRKEAGRAHA
jgi:hypothetical protein